MRKRVVALRVKEVVGLLSAGQNIDKNVNGKPEVAQVVNLLVTPEQAEILSLAGTGSPTGAGK